MAKLAKGANTPVTASNLRVLLTWRPGPAVPDLDTAALLLTGAGKVRSDQDFVFYNQPLHPSGAVRHEGRRDEAGAALESLTIDTARLEPGVDRIALTASAGGGTFGAVPGLSLRLADAATGAPIAEFDITGASETAMVAGELYRRGTQWKFRAVGQGYASGLAGLATEYGIQVDDAPAPAPAAPEISLKKQKLISLEKRLETEAPGLLALTRKAAVSLEKRGLGEHTARVAICLDISASMRRLYKKGKIQQLAERVLALGMRFDDDAEIEVFLFGDDAHQAGSLNLGNFGGFVDAMIARYGFRSATRYGRAMRLIRSHYFGSDQPRQSPFAADLPVYVMFVTDGATADRKETVDQVVASSYEPLFWQFLAISKNPRDSQFKLLRQLDDLPGRHLDNASFGTVADPSAISDEELFELLMTEYPGWIGQARARGLLPR